MKIIESIEEMREYSQELKKNGLTIGHVSTDSFLHEGHMFLVKSAKENADVVVLDICHAVDYITCSPKEYKKRLGAYKETTLENDKKLCALNNVNVFFAPSMEQLYLDIPDLYFNEIKAKHPTFHPGALLCISAFHSMLKIVMPDVLLLGEKDFYQNIALKSLVEEFGLPMKLRVVPTVRDSDGSAFSSRNSQLTKAERGKALSMPETLKEISEWSSYPSVKEIKKYFISAIKNAGGQTWYADVCDATTGEPVSVVDKEVVFAVATNFGSGVYLSDNILISPK